MPLLNKVFPLFLLFLLSFSVQGQPPPPGYKYNEMTIVNHSIIQKHNLKELSTSKGPYTGEPSDETIVENHLDKIHKTIVCLGDNLKLFNSEVAKENATELVILLNENSEQSLDTVRFDQIKANAKLICATNDLDEQKHYFSLISENIQQLFRIK